MAKDNFYSDFGKGGDDSKNFYSDFQTKVRRRGLTKRPDQELSVMDEAGKGFMRGLTDLAGAVNTGIQYAGERLGSKGLTEMGKSGHAYWEKKSSFYQPNAAIQGNVVDNPELLGKASWWAYNVANFIPSIAASLTGAGTAGAAIRVGGAALRWTPEVIGRLAKIGQAISGGAVGGSLEGASTYQEVLKEGGTEEEAARSAELMALASAGLNALSTGRILAESDNILKKFLVAGATEGVTEAAEEPAEAIIKDTVRTGEINPEHFKQSLKSAATVLGPAALVGGGASVLSGSGGGSEQNAPIDEQTPVSGEQPAKGPLESAIQTYENGVDYEPTGFTPRQPGDGLSLETPENPYAQYEGGVDYVPSQDGLAKAPDLSVETTREADRRVAIDERLSGLRQETKDIVTPEGYDDARLKRVPYRQQLEELSKAKTKDRTNDVDPETDDLLTAIRKQGGISIEESKAQGIDPEHIKDMPGANNPFRKEGKSFDEMAEALSQHGYFGPDEEVGANALLDKVSTHLSGTAVRSHGYNPDYEQGMSLAREGQQPKKVQRIIGKALAGKKLGVVESRIMTSLLDEVSGERSKQADDMKLAREYKKKLLPPELVSAYSDDIKNAGQLYEEDHYLPEMNAETRSMTDLVIEASEYDQGAVEKLLEKDDDSFVASELFKVIENGRRNRKDQQTDQAEAGATEPGGHEPGAESVQQTEKREAEPEETKQVKRRKYTDTTPFEYTPQTAENNDIKHFEKLPEELKKPVIDKYNEVLGKLATMGVSIETPVSVWITLPKKDEIDALRKTISLITAYTELLSRKQRLDNRLNAEQKLRAAIGMPLREVSAEEGAEIDAVVEKAKKQKETRRQKTKGYDMFLDTPENIDQAAHEAATSPKNDLPEPTQAQKEAGNYKVGHVMLHGFQISIENPKGSTRSGTDRDGNEWSITMKHHYGYILGTVGKDKDHIDVFLGPDAGNLELPVFVIDQVNPGKPGVLDEHKVMLGFKTLYQAKRGYLSNYEKGWEGLGAITQMSLDEFKAWLKDGDTAKPVGELQPGGKTTKPVEKPKKPEPETTSAVPDATVYGVMGKGNHAKIGDIVESNNRRIEILSVSEKQVEYRFVGVLDKETWKPVPKAKTQRLSFAQFQRYFHVFPETEKAPATEAASDFGADNTVFTKDAADAARERLKKKLSQLNSGIDPQILQDGIILGGYYVEAGTRKFAEFTKTMVADLGEDIRPYLKTIYLGIRNWPGFDKEGMESEAEIEQQAPGDILKADQPEKANEPAQLEEPSESPLEGVPADKVPGTTEGGDVGTSAGSSRGADTSGNEPVGEPGVSEPRSMGADEGAIPVSTGGTGAKRPGRSGKRTGTAISGNKPGNKQSKKSVKQSEPQADIFEAADQLADNYVLTDADAIGEGGAKTKFKNNIAAIRLLKTLEAENRRATRDEQAVLVKYVGWGGIPQAFYKQDDSVTKGWEKEADELRELLTEEEYAAARRSTQDAHYTSTEIVNSIWAAVKQFGFKGGRVLEPSVGVGNFFGLMPESLRSASQINGVELDHITGGIAKNLYPKANIQSPMGFQNFAAPDNYFDLAIGNPPFGDQKLYDGRRKHLSKFSIHNYFFAKSIDTLAPNGVLAMVVSNYLMDSSKSQARQYMAERTELLGAIRLPNNAFLKTAGTEVTTDIVFLRKLDEGEASKGESWTGIESITDDNGKKVPLNEYFVRHPEMMLGKFGAYGTMYREDSPALVANEGQDTGALFKQAIGSLPSGFMSNGKASPPKEVIPISAGIADAKVGSMFIADDGNVHIRLEDELEQPRSESVEFANNKAQLRVQGMIRVRDAFTELRQLQLKEGVADKRIERARKQLNEVYDKFVRANGPINNDANKRLFREDPTWPQIAALEENYDKGLSPAVAKKTGEKARKPSAEKAAIFTKRTQYPYKSPDKAKTAKDALVASLAENGRVDLEYMSWIYGKDADEITEELQGLLFKHPNGTWITRDEYLSGNVKMKLKHAIRAAEKDSSFIPNVQALQDVQPADIEAVDIDVKPGAHWVPAKHIADFVSHITGNKASAVFDRVNNRWMLDSDGVTASKNTEFGTDRMSPVAILSAVANQKKPTVYDLTHDKKRTINESATTAAGQKAEKIKAEWRRWIWEDDARRKEVAELYNAKFNTDVLREYDGSHLTFPGKISDDIIRFRPHQANAIWRIVQNGTTLLDHVVGAGKTYTMIGGAMELRRLGTARKPVFAVPNHLVGQWAEDFIKLYPGANILATTKKDFEKANRKRLFARIATGDWDAVIVAHSSFGKVMMDPEFQELFIKQQIQEIDRAMDEIRASQGKRSRSVKQAEKQKEKLQAKLEKLYDSGAKDDSLSFGELGIDALFVDEAHEFKNLGFATSMSVTGLGNPVGSQKAADLFMKIQYLLERTGGRNLVFATGTPISNTMAEMYTVQRYMQYEEMKELGLVHFDAWANMFGEVVTDWELSPAGKYKLNSRFSKFVNMPELMAKYLSFADVINRDDINRQLAEQGKKLPVPKVKGGKPQNIVVERSSAQAQYIGEPIVDENGQETDKYPEGTLIWRSEHLPKGPPKKGDDNMLKIMSDARKAALDMRLLNSAYGDYDGSKVNESSRRIKRLYNKWNKVKGTQLVFIDLSTPKNARGKEAARIQELITMADAGDEKAQEQLDKLSPDELSALDSEFSVYDDLKQKLIKLGIPEKEIAFIHDANTEQQKEELFGKVRSGKIRVLLGSTAKMGAGMNVQTRLVGLHHLDAPWRPSDLEQREGRIIRQGNILYDADPEGFEVEINRYATKQTLDSRMWQTIESKARFIGQVRKGNMKTREIEDLGSEAANAAEMKAASSGNPLILEEMDLRQKIRKLEQLQTEHMREQHSLKAKISEYERRLNSDRSKLEPTKADAETAAKAPKKFAATINGKAYTKSTEAGKAIINSGLSMIANKKKSMDLGETAGFTLRLESDGSLILPNRMNIMVKGEREWKLEYADLTEANDAGLMIKINNIIKRMISEPERLEKDIAYFESEINKLKNMGGAWSEQAELDALTQRHTEVIEALRPKPKAETEEKPDQESESDVSRLSVASVEKKGRTVAAVEADVRKITSKWKEAPTIRVVQTDKELPSEIVDQILQARAAGKVEGVFYRKDQSIYLVADKLPDSQTVQTVVFHEALGHFGLRKMFGERLVPLLKSVANSYGDAGLASIAKEYHLDLNDPIQRLVAAEEKLARIAETGERPGFVKRLIAIVRAWLRENGFTLKLSDNDILKIVADVARTVTHGTGKTSGKRSGGTLTTAPARFSIAMDEIVTDLEPTGKKSRKSLKTHARDVVKTLENLGPLAKLEDSQQYLLDRYLTLGNIAKFREAAQDIHDTFRKATNEQSKRIYHYLTTKDADMTAATMDGNQALADKAKETKKHIIQIGRQLASRGMISEEVQEQHEGEYLPRVYLHYLLGDKAIKAIGGGRKVSDMGYTKARKDIPEEIREIILGEVKDPAYLAARAVSVPMRDLAILDWLAKISTNSKWVLPEQFVEWTFPADGNTRNVTPFWLKSQADLIRNQSRYYEEDAKAKALETANEMDRLANEALDAVGLNTDSVPTDYRQIPNSARYGMLRGMYVQKEIYNDVVGISDFMPENAGTAEKILGYGGIGTKITQVWKWSKVAANPPAQVRNFISNMVLLHLSGVPMTKIPGYLLRAVKDIRAKGKYYNIGRKYGLTESTFSNQELGRMEKDLLELQAQKEGKGFSLAKAKLAFATIQNVTGDIYQFSETLGKTMKIMHMMEKQGVEESVAALEAQKWLFDYSLVGRNTRYLRNAPIGMPFLTFYLKVLPRLLETAIEHPQRYLPYVALLMGLPALIAAQFDVDDDDVEALKKALPQWLSERGHTLILPMRDSQGRWVVMDIGYFFPWTMWTDTAMNLAKGELGKAFLGTGLLGGPVPDIITAIKTNTDSFTGKTIVDKRDPPQKQLGAIMTYLYGMAMPSWLVGATYPIFGTEPTAKGFAGHLYQAVTGHVDKYGDPSSTIGQALARLGGVNLYPLDPIRTRTANIRHKRYEIKEVKKRMLYQLRNRNLSKEQRLHIIEQYRDRMQTLSGDLQRYIRESRVNPRLQ